MEAMKVSGSGRSGRWWALGAWTVLGAGLSGCEVDSFLDPSVIGRWERTPVVMPILDSLDVIDEPPDTPPGLTQVTAEDLLPQPREYQVGPGDTMMVSVMDLIIAGQESVQQRRIDGLGNIRLAELGSVQVTGLSEREIEEKIKDLVVRMNILKDPTVTVFALDQRQNTYTVMGEPRNSGTAIGRYNILRPDFRLMDAMAQARGVSGRIKTLQIIRQVRMAEVGGVDPTHPAPAEADDRDLLLDPTSILEQPTSDASDPMGEGMGDALAPSAQWQFIGGRWVRVDRASSQPVDLTADAGPRHLPPVTQRIIEIPYQRLLNGEMQYNIGVRPGDIINVPSPVIGNVFIMGAIARPGTFALPGDKDLTLKLLVAAAGGLNQLAWPDRVDLTRRVGENMEATVRLNLKSIFDGRQPDFFLKPNDMINVGQSFWSVPLAVLRNGFRYTYGFGFVLDRNFNNDIFGPPPR